MCSSQQFAIWYLFYFTELGESGTDTAIGTGARQDRVDSDCGAKTWKQRTQVSLPKCGDKREEMRCKPQQIESSYWYPTEDQTVSKVGGSNYLEDKLDVKAREGDTCIRLQKSRQEDRERTKRPPLVRTVEGWLHA